MSPHTVFDLSPSSLDYALKALKAGGIVVCPSDTVYGLLVDASNENAVKKLISFKERPVGKAISIFGDGFEMLERVVDARALTESARSLLPGPYTLVLPSRGVVSKLLESEKKTLGVRLIGNKAPSSKLQVPSNVQDPRFNIQTMTGILSEAERIRKISHELDTQPNHVIPGVSQDLTQGDSSMRWNDKVTFESLSSPADFVTTLVHAFGGPVTATSANLAGKPSCYSIQALLGQLSSRKLAHLDLLIDAGELPHRDPSTVIDLTSPTPQVLRGTSMGQTIVTHSPEETMDVAEDFITGLLSAHRSQLSTINSQFVIYLHGDLGAGKTHFVKGIARHFGFDRITSPTYLGMQEYKNEQLHLYHVDLYNFESSEDIDALQLGRLIEREVPNTKYQAPNKLQIPNSNQPSSVIPGLSRDLTQGDSSIHQNDKASVIPSNEGIQSNDIPNIIMPAHQTNESRSSYPPVILSEAKDPLSHTTTVIPIIICIEWPEKGTLPYPGVHVYMEYGGDGERSIRITQSEFS